MSSNSVGNHFLVHRPLHEKVNLTENYFHFIILAFFIWGEGVSEKYDFRAYFMESPLKYVFSFIIFRSVLSLSSLEDYSKQMENVDKLCCVV